MGIKGFFIIIKVCMILFRSLILKENEVKKFYFIVNENLNNLQMVKVSLKKWVAIWIFLTVYQFATFIW